jgi:ATP-dependent protease HslVU (ClpYQ) peptidase subunit
MNPDHDNTAPSRVVTIGSRHDMHRLLAQLATMSEADAHRLVDDFQARLRRMESDAGALTKLAADLDPPRRTDRAWRRAQKRNAGRP